jgi:hypothetical protein
MDVCWVNLPVDILYHHILPRCDIDVRLAFHISPRRLSHINTNFPALQQVLRRRHVDSSFCDFPGQHHYRIPIWQAGEDDCNISKQSIVSLYIVYIFIRQPTLKMLLLPLSERKQMMSHYNEITHILVDKFDSRDENTFRHKSVGSVYISPDGTFETKIY